MLSVARRRFPLPAHRGEKRITAISLPPSQKRPSEAVSRLGRESMLNQAIPFSVVRTLHHLLDD